jgi:hypothetical protein
MQLTIHTERGTFTSKKAEATAKEMAQIKGLIQKAAEDGKYFTLETDAGYVVIGKELLRTAAFVVEA